MNNEIEKVESFEVNNGFPVLEWSCENPKGCGQHFYSTVMDFHKCKHLCEACLHGKYFGLWQQLFHDGFFIKINVNEKKAEENKFNKMFSKSFKVNKIKPITQKAKGLLELKTSLHGKQIQCAGLALPEYYVIQEEKDIEPAYLKLTTYSKKVFARPCPFLPTHGGFLDSRPVKNIDEIKELFKQVKEMDNQGELVLMPLIEANYNAVVTPTMVTIGKGRDGATGGNKAITLPVSGELINEKELPNSSVKTEPYLEVVYTSDQSYAVQLRDGPKLARIKDLVYEDFTVDEIIDIDKLSGSEIGIVWEKTCRQANEDRKNGKRLGLVIVHLNGGVCSHFAIHAQLNGLPFVTTFMPVIGQRLEKTGEKAELNYREVKKGIELGLSEEFSNLWSNKIDRHGSDLGSNAFKPLLLSALYGLHSFTVATSAESKLIGFGISNLIRLSVSAALGEARHHRGLNNIQGNMSRDTVYKKYFFEVLKGIKKLQITEQIFLDGSWSGSYGGKKWASCTHETLRLVNKVISFVRRPEEREFLALMGQFNRLVNEIHNGGKFLNKFINNEAFDRAANNQALYVARYGSQIYEFISLVNGLNKTSNSLAGFKQIKKMTKKDKEQLKVILDAVDKYNPTDPEEEEFER